MMPSNHLILCCPLLLLPSIFPSIRVFSNESALRIRWPEYWSLASVLPMNIQGWFPLGLTGFISCSPRDSQESSPTPQWKASILWHSAFFITLTSIHDYWKNHRFDYIDLVVKVMSLLFNMLSRFVIAFLPRNKHLLISRLQSSSAVILEPKKLKSHFTLFPHLFVMEWWDWMPWSSFFECWVLSQLFHSPISPSSRGSLVPLLFCYKGGVICVSEVIDISPSSLDSSLCFIQPSISHDTLCI